MRIMTRLIPRSLSVRMNGRMLGRAARTLAQRQGGPGSEHAGAFVRTPRRAVPLRDVQEAASHADPRTTMRYDRARGSLDRHATYIVAAYVAGAAR
jgi:integrase/recombinase XerD